MVYEDVELDGERFTSGDEGGYAEAYLTTAPPAVQGSGGRPQTMRVVCRLIRHYLLSTTDALSLLTRVYNPRCSPEWERRDLESFVQAAWALRGKPGNENSSPVACIMHATGETLNTAYSAILAGMTLSLSDEAALLKRGITNDEISRLGYKTWDGSITHRKELLAEVHALIGDEMYLVPGIYRTPYGPDLGGSPGLALPVRDARGLIVGIRIRVVGKNKKGEPEKKYFWLSARPDNKEDAKAEAHVHHPLHAAGAFHTVGVTEGEIKADLSTLKSGELYLSVPGVGSWRAGLDAACALGTKRLLVAYDADCLTNPGVAQAVVFTYDGALVSGVTPVIQTWDKAAGKGLDDVLAGDKAAVKSLEGEDARIFVEKLAKKHDIRRRDAAQDAVDDALNSAEVDSATGAVATTKPEDWKKFLKKTKAGKILAHAHNIEVFFRKHPEWEGKRIGWDIFNQRPVWLSPPPPSWLKTYPDSTSIVRGTPWTDESTTRFIATMNRAGIDVGRDTVRHTMQSVAKPNSYHPVREYLDALKWDGQRRLGLCSSGNPGACWMTTYLGSPDTGHTRKAGTWWMIQAVRRIFEPGALAKYVLTLEGLQDKGKSTAIKILTGAQWFSETQMEPEALNSMLALQGVWVQDIPEGAMLTKHDKKAVKGWISKPSDHYVPKWSNDAVTVPRQVSFTMTTNETHYLNDATGGVRFWPVKITLIDFDGLARDRDQLWAEAVALYRAGMIPEPRSEADKKLFAEEVADRNEGDIWDARIAAYLVGKNTVTVEDIATNCMDIKANSQERKDQFRIGDILKRFGWVQPARRPTIDGARVRVYVRPEAKVEARPLTFAEQGPWKGLLALGWTEEILPDGTRQMRQPDVQAAEIDMEVAV